MAKRIRPRPGWAEKARSRRCCALGRENVGIGAYKIDAGNEMTLSGKSDDGLVPEFGVRVKVQPNPLRRESSGFDKDGGEQGHVRLPFGRKKS